MTRRWTAAFAAAALLSALSFARAQGAPAAAAPLAGTVAETMDAGRYTYIRVDTGSGSEWVASAHLEVNVGDTVAIRGGHTMRNFESPTMNRTFDRILFAEHVQVGDGTAPVPGSLPPGHPPVAPQGQDEMNVPGDAENAITGEIVETTNTGNYTYILVRSAEKSLWVATERFNAAVGERIHVPGGMLTKNFESPTLGRTFDEILFAELVQPAPAEAPAAQKSGRAYADPAAVAAQPLIEQPAGATSVADIHARRAELAGQEITVRGRITKYTPRVLGRNWIHLADGTGEADSRDLAVSTTDSANVGDVVTFRGRVAVDEDLGHGYQYSVLIKDATIAAQ